MALLVTDWVAFLFVRGGALLLLLQSMVGMPNHIREERVTAILMLMFTWTVVQCSLGTCLHSWRWIVVHTWGTCSCCCCGGDRECGDEEPLKTKDRPILNSFYA